MTDWYVEQKAMGKNNHNMKRAIVSSATQLFDTFYHIN